MTLSRRVDTPKFLATIGFPHPGTSRSCSVTQHSLSRDAVEHRVTHYAARAAETCPSLRGKAITAHVLRHTTAMRLLHAGVDTSVIALWLGHESVDTTQIYLHADLKLKEKALARTTPPNSRAGRYQPTDQLIAWLEAL
jgi:integrase/recombinase XerD